MPTAVSAQVSIGGYDVYVAKNSYVDERALELPAVRSAVEEKIAYILQNPGAVGLRLHGPLSWFKRAHLPNNLRIYVRVFDSQRIVVIVAVDTASDFKRDEGAGAIDEAFVHVLHQYEQFDWARVRPFEALREQMDVLDEDREDTRYRNYKPKYIVGTEDVSPAAAEAVLAAVPRRRASNGVFEWIYMKITRRVSDRILMDPISEGLAKDDAGVKKCRMDLSQYLKKRHLPWVVRCDTLSGKLLIVPRAKLDVYCWGLRGRR